MKIGYQLKQVRERLAKGLVDKGVLRTEKRNFLLFDMATHPIADLHAKEDVLRRTLSLLTARTAAVPAQALHKEGVKYRHMRAVVLVCAAYASSVLENALQRLSYDSREAAFARCDDILAEFCTWPFGVGTSTTSGPVNIGSGGAARKREGGSGGVGRESVQELVREVRKEMATPSTGNGQGDDEDLCFEVVATVLEIFGRMDSLVSCLRETDSAGADGNSFSFERTRVMLRWTHECNARLRCYDLAVNLSHKYMQQRVKFRKKAAGATLVSTYAREAP
jgi:Golgi phosphoprotein 3